MAVRGQGVTMSIETATSTYTLLGGQRNCSWSYTTGSIDTTVKSDELDKTYIPGEKEWSGSADGVLNVADTAWLKILSNRSSDVVTGVRFTDGVNTYTGECVFTEVSTDAPQDDLMTYSLSFQGTGALVTASV